LSAAACSLPSCGKLNKDISFALRRGTIAQVSTAAAAAEAELALRVEKVVNLVLFCSLQPAAMVLLVLQAQEGHLVRATPGHDLAK
jgi:hypothetical protein